MKKATMKKTAIKKVLARGALALGLSLGLLTTAAHADVVINAPIIIRSPRSAPASRDQTVVIEFVAPGDEWANVRLNGRRVFAPRNFNRRERIRVEPGAYYLELTGFDRFEVWSTGYLDVGRNNSNVVVVTISRRQGVQVSGDPYTWLPDGEPVRR
ncbi:MAG: hypothetical protein AAFZ80_00725 [Cyanobacteria bacterium P01_A01_bin.105]